MATMGIKLLKALFFYKEYCITLQKNTFSRGLDCECDRMFLNGRLWPKRKLFTTFKCNPFHVSWDFVIRELGSGFWLLIFRLFTKHLNPRWNLKEHSFSKQLVSLVTPFAGMQLNQIVFVCHLLWLKTILWGGCFLKSILF